ncbi:restriction endonuclease [Rhizobium oryzicola]|uniref:Restriction endonuclease n=1 Tax=Rhizobium oryzicola TaxID=1232668 RepID=A0ABT8SRC7_9HYPH|nr:restriction endonuclease [Rhizobium oryzicola]MDO1580978.1 restriction endonuclease [Rhizobium oryzicola]
MIHQTLEAVGWNADVEKIVEQVKRLDIGLPAEDEFSVLCAWLGKCELLHKLEQHQMPRASKKAYQVPDILAFFSTQSLRKPVLIEVKSKRANTLSFSPDYLARLENYANMVDMPLLIAWKFYSMWVLFEAKHLKKMKRNFNISFGDALKENLLGVLAGDLAYKIGRGAGIHFRLEKEEILSVDHNEDGRFEQWQMRLSEVAFSGREGESITNLSDDVRSLFATWDLEMQEDHADDHIWVRHTAGNDGIQFAHTALVRLLDWSLPDGAKRSWRREARKENLNTITDFRRAVTKAIDEKVVQFVLDLQPHTMPDFVKPRIVEKEIHLRVASGFVLD